MWWQAILIIVPVVFFLLLPTLLNLLKRMFLGLASILTSVFDVDVPDDDDEPLVY
jgi:hypothetical protein